MKYFRFGLTYLSSSAALADGIRHTNDDSHAGFSYFCGNPDTKDQAVVEPNSEKKCPEGYQRYIDVTVLTEFVEGAPPPHQQNAAQEAHEK